MKSKIIWPELSEEWRSCGRSRSEGAGEMMNSALDLLSITH